MILSIPIVGELVSTNVVDSTPSYSATTQRTYSNEGKFKENGSVYEYSGETFYPKSFLLSDEPSYILNQVVFKDGYNQKVLTTGQTTLFKMPSQYASTSSGFNSELWLNQYAQIQTGVGSLANYAGFEESNGGVTHKLYRDSASTTGWRYKITKTTSTQSWTTPVGDLYTHPYNGFSWVRDTGTISAYFDDIEVLTDVPSIEPTPNVTTHISADTYRVGDVIQYIDNGDVIWYKIQKLVTNTVTIEYIQDVVVTEALTFSTNIQEITIPNPDLIPPTFGWLAGTLVIDNGVLYVNTGKASNETYTTSNTTYQKINSIVDFPLFFKLGVTNELKPFDGSTNTYATGQNTMSYKVKGISKFDTIALSKIIGDRVDIIFKNNLGVIVNAVSLAIDGSRDENNDLESVESTSIAYATSTLAIGSTAELVIYGASIKLGELILGMSADAGFATLALSNGAIDLSTYTTDQFGDTDTVERAKIATSKVNCDIYIKDYDRNDRLIRSVIGKKIIVNTSGIKNSIPNGRSVFSIGFKYARVSDFSQASATIEDGSIMQLASYDMTVTEV